MRVLAASYLQIARNPIFLAWTSLNDFGYASYFGFFSSSAYLFIEYFHPSRIGFSLVISGASVSAGKARPPAVCAPR